MPPKKRTAAADGDEPAVATGNEQLRRSSRGGGHKAPSPPASKKAAAPKSKSNGNKKAKTAAADETATDKDGKDDSSANAPTEPGANGDKLEAADKTAEKVGDKDAETGVAVPAENKEAAKQTKRIEVGESVPGGIILKNEKDEDVSIDDITKEKGVVFFVYPKANTPGCTNQACLFRDSYAEFGPLGYEVYGLSSDSPKSQASWKEKNNFQYSFLCDPAQLLLKLLGAAKGVKSNQRSHYIVEKGGKLIDAQYTISPKDSASKALEFIKGQQK
ncbi:thioredoxin peroxidase dot5 [Cystobasidiomycetes sp. EMM_F5]